MFERAKGHPLRLAFAAQFAYRCCKATAEAFHPIVTGEVSSPRSNKPGFFLASLYAATQQQCMLIQFPYRAGKPIISLFHCHIHVKARGLCAPAVCFSMQSSAGSHASQRRSMPQNALHTPRLRQVLVLRAMQWMRGRCVRAGHQNRYRELRCPVSPVP